jgi:hypothetical protein
LYAIRLRFFEKNLNPKSIRTSSIRGKNDLRRRFFLAAKAKILLVFKILARKTRFLTLLKVG